jgi:phosphatidylserine/phosphatidylglycerophosphate/cardiolipin synthase-like enzyme
MECEQSPRVQAWANCDSFVLPTAMNPAFFSRLFVIDDNARSIDRAADHRILKAAGTAAAIRTKSSQVAHAGTRGNRSRHLMLYEHKYWGDGTSNVIADSNPRLEMLIDAARRGAKVRLLLDSFFDDSEALRSNQATVEYLATIAAAEGIDIMGAVGNPTGGGIHMKLVLVQVGGETWTALGSLNGGEISYKINREVVLMIDEPVVYARLLEVFLRDWALTTR